MALTSEQLKILNWGYKTSGAQENYGAFNFRQPDGSKEPYGYALMQLWKTLLSSPKESQIGIGKKQYSYMELLSAAWELGKEVVEECDLDTRSETEPYMEKVIDDETTSPAQMPEIPRKAINQIFALGMMLIE